MLLAAILGLIAFLMMPSPRNISEGNTGRYGKSGKYIVFLLSMVVLAVAVALLYEYVKLHKTSIWVVGNLTIFFILGSGLIAGNLKTLRDIRFAQNAPSEVVEGEIVEAEVLTEEQLELEALARPPVEESPPQMLPPRPRKKKKVTFEIDEDPTESGNT